MTVQARHGPGVGESDVRCFILEPAQSSGQPARSAERGQTAGNAVWHRQGAGTVLSHTRLLSHHCYSLWLAGRQVATENSREKRSATHATPRPSKEVCVVGHCSMERAQLACGHT